MKEGIKNVLSSIGRAFEVEMKTEAGKMNRITSLGILVLLLAVVIVEPLIYIVDNLMKFLEREPVGSFPSWLVPSLIFLFVLEGAVCLYVLLQHPSAD